MRDCVSVLVICKLHNNLIKKEGAILETRSNSLLKFGLGHFSLSLSLFCFSQVYSFISTWYITCFRRWLSYKRFAYRQILYIIEHYVAEAGYLLPVTGYGFVYWLLIRFTGYWFVYWLLIRITGYRFVYWLLIRFTSYCLLIRITGYWFGLLVTGSFTGYWFVYW